MKLREVEQLPGATWLVGGRVGLHFLVYCTAELWTYASGFWGLHWPQKWFPRERCCVMPEMKWIKGSFSVTAPASYRFFFLFLHITLIASTTVHWLFKLKKKKKFTAQTLLSEWTKGYSSSQESFCAKKDKEIWCREGTTMMSQGNTRKAECQASGRLRLEFLFFLWLLGMSSLTCSILFSSSASSGL